MIDLSSLSIITMISSSFKSFSTVESSEHPTFCIAIQSTYGLTDDHQSRSQPAHTIRYIQDETIV